MFLKFILQLGTGEKTASSHSGVSSGYADIMAVTWMHSSVTDMSMNDAQQRKPGIVGLESGYPKTCHMHTPFFGTELLPTALSTIFTSYRYQDRTRPSFALQCWTGIKPLKLILCKYSDWNLYVWMYMYNIVFTYIHIIIWTHTHTHAQIHRFGSQSCTVRIICARAAKLALLVEGCATLQGRWRGWSKVPVVWANCIHPMDCLKC